MEENKISVSELINSYNKLTSTKLKEEFIKSKINIKNYVGYATKCFIAENIVNNSSMKDGFVCLDSCKRYMLYIYALISTYTNIKINKNNIIEDYDLLESNNLIDVILSLIPEKEVKGFDIILKMKQDDLMTNKYEIHGYINNAILNLYPKISENLSPLLDTLNSFINNIDINQLIKNIK